MSQNGCQTWMFLESSELHHAKRRLGPALLVHVACEVASHIFLYLNITSVLILTTIANGSHCRYLIADYLLPQWIIATIQDVMATTMSPSSARWSRKCWTSTPNLSATSTMYVLPLLCILAPPCILIDRTAVKHPRRTRCQSLSRDPRLSPRP